MVARTRQAAQVAQTQRSPSPQRRMRGGKAQVLPKRRQLTYEEEPPSRETPAQEASCSVVDGGESSCEPCTPTEGEAAAPLSPEAPLPLDEAVENHILMAAQSWRHNLLVLQPKVQLLDEVVLGTLNVMRAFAAARQDLHQLLHTSAPHLFTYTAASLWMVAKMLGVRTLNPNRSLMSQATQVHPQALSDYELDVLVSLSWDLAAVLRRAGLL